MVGAGFISHLSTGRAERCQQRAGAGAPALLALLTCAGCEPTPQGVQTTSLQFLAPSADAVLHHPRVEIGIPLPGTADATHLEVRLGKRDLSARFTPGYRRMRSLGGGAIATIDVSDEPPGPLMVHAVWADAVAPAQSRRSKFRSSNQAVPDIPRSIPIRACTVPGGATNSPDSADQSTVPMAESVSPRLRTLSLLPRNST